MKKPEIRLGHFTLDPDTAVLKDSGGRRVALRHQATEVLRGLAARLNNVVERDQLLQSIWDNRQGAEEGLIQCIADIRRALGDTDRSIVETVPRKGYRLVSDGSTKHAAMIVMTIKAAAVLVVAGIASSAAWWFLASPRPVTKPVIAVLPFENAGSTDDTVGLQDLVSESIISSLARYPEFAVIARQSSFQFRGDTRGVREIGRALGADYLVQGSQLLVDRNLRISVQLIDAHDGKLELVDALDVPLDDLFETNDTIAFRIANTLSGAVSDLNARNTRRTGDVDALVLNNRARRLFQSGPSREKWLAALALNGEAIRKYPDAEWGYLGRALMLRTGLRFGWESDDKTAVLAEAYQLARKSIDLAPQNYLTHFALGRVLMQRGDIAGSIAAFERASDINPSSALVLNALGQSYLYAGDVDAVKRTTKKVALIDPLPGMLTIWMRAWGQWLAGDCEDAHATVTFTSTLPLEANKLRAAIYMCHGDSEKAIAAIDEYLAKYPDWTRELELETNAANWAVDGPRDRWLAALSDAGMPN